MSVGLCLNNGKWVVKSDSLSGFTHALHEFINEKGNILEMWKINRKEITRICWWNYAFKFFKTKVSKISILGGLLWYSKRCCEFQTQTFKGIKIKLVEMVI